jgi:hypothetical protein
MKSSLDHLPERKQRELGRVVELIHEEFADALSGGTADFKKKAESSKSSCSAPTPVAPGSMNRTP